MNKEGEEWNQFVRGSMLFRSHHHESRLATMCCLANSDEEGLPMCTWQSIRASRCRWLSSCFHPWQQVRSRYGTCSSKPICSPRSGTAISCRPWTSAGGCEKLGVLHVYSSSENDVTIVAKLKK